MVAHELQAEITILKVTKAVLVLYSSEVFEAIQQRPDIFAQALRRGKHFARAEKFVLR